MSYFKSLKQLLNMFILETKIKILTNAIVRADLISVEKNINFETLHNKDNIGNTPLHLAILSNNVEIVKSLLKFKPDLESKNKFGQTALMLTCEISSTKNPYYRILVTPKGDNEIIKKKCFKIVQLLVKAGANIHTQDKNETTPIIKATLKENEFIVEYLLENCNIYQKDKKNGTVAAYAIECQNQKLLKLLLETMNTNDKFNEFISYVKTISFIARKTTIEDIILLKQKMDLGKRKYNLESMLGIKTGRTRQVKI